MHTSALRPTDINDQQWQAVQLRGSHLLIVAGPGTGKTHTLVGRIISLSREISSSEKILAITFTNKAAQEMRERLHSKLPNLDKNIEAGTFHKFCIRILRDFSSFSRIGRNFSIASDDQAGQFFKEIWPDLKGKPRRAKLKSISEYKQKEELSDFPEDILAYNQLLRKNNVLDFDDILCEALYLLKINKDVLKKIQNQYRYIFVDEYQDINSVQHSLLKLIASERNLLTAIGDPNQAIYGFRGSDIRFFKSFLKDFTGAQELTLRENYRSTENLLSASSQVVQKGENSYIPELVAKIYSQGQLVVSETATGRAEAEYVVHQVEQMIGGTSMFSQDSGRVKSYEDGCFGFSDIAVLYRLNSQRRIIEEAFHRSGIPYQVSGDKSLIDYKEAMEVVSFLRPKINQEIGEIQKYLLSVQKTKKTDIFQKLLTLANESQTTYEFFDNLFLQRENDLIDRKAEKVSLLTLHSAKGLEFSAVFIVGCEEGLIPLMQDNKETDIQEERRLFYVGMTRAKEKLYLLRAKKRSLYGKTCLTKSSPFLSDIEEGLKCYEKENVFHKRKKKDQDQLNFLKDFG